MVSGLLWGLDHEDAAKFTSLLAIPIKPAAGVLNLPTWSNRRAMGSAGARERRTTIGGSAGIYHRGYIVHVKTTRE